VFSFFFFFLSLSFTSIHFNAAFATLQACHFIQNTYRPSLPQLSVIHHSHLTPFLDAQASITTHIARSYWYDNGDGTGEWGPNLAIFQKNVGVHKKRLNNMYFGFLFVLRAVTRAGPILAKYPIHTGDQSEDETTRRVLRALVLARDDPNLAGAESARVARASLSVASRLDGNSETCDSAQESAGGDRESVPVYEEEGTGAGGGAGEDGGFVSCSREAQQCRVGFDESSLFQVGQRQAEYGPYTSPIDASSPSHLALQRAEKSLLREEFRLRFRNISTIMDCVSCERCRVWGKLQILGLGTAIKILLSSSGPSGDAAEGDLPDLSRQEVIALINTLNQFARSVEFAALVDEDSSGGLGIGNGIGKSHETEGLDFELQGWPEKNFMAASLLEVGRGLGWPVYVVLVYIALLMFYIYWFIWPHPPTQKLKKQG
jgi:hypothetical protein